MQFLIDTVQVDAFRMLRNIHVQQNCILFFILKKIFQLNAWKESFKLMMLQTSQHTFIFELSIVSNSSGSILGTLLIKSSKNLPMLVSGWILFAYKNCVYSKWNK